tara:strand:+ start:659 stop:931 length:273 start_codon:yes stop_codon:yes gene_type:complete
MKNKTFANKSYLEKRAKDNRHITREFINDKVSEFLDKGGGVTQLDYMGDTNFDLEGEDYVDSTKNGFKNTIRNGEHVGGSTPIRDENGDR